MPSWSLFGPITAAMIDLAGATVVLMILMGVMRVVYMTIFNTVEMVSIRKQLVDQQHQITDLRDDIRLVEVKLDIRVPAKLATELNEATEKEAEIATSAVVLALPGNRMDNMLSNQPTPVQRAALRIRYNTMPRR